MSSERYEDEKRSTSRSSRWDQPESQYANSQSLAKEISLQTLRQFSSYANILTPNPIFYIRSKSSSTQKSYIDQQKREERARSRDGPYEREESSSSRYGLQDRKRDASSSEKDEKATEEAKPEPQFKPNFKASGALAAAARTTETGVVLKFAPPAEARVPNLKWRLFPFKGDDALPPITIHEKSSYLLGRDRDVCDVPLDHLSCSTQHAVIVHRQVSKTDPTTGLRSYVIKPFLIDLESRNGTFLNDVRIDDSRYYELMEKDCIRFGASSREYIVLNERSK